MFGFFIDERGGFHFKHIPDSIEKVRLFFKKKLASAAPKSSDEHELMKSYISDVDSYIKIAACFRSLDHGQQEQDKQLQNDRLQKELTRQLEEATQQRDRAQRERKQVEGWNTDLATRLKQKDDEVEQLKRQLEDYKEGRYYIHPSSRSPVQLELATRLKQTEEELGSRTAEVAQLKRQLKDQVGYSMPQSPRNLEQLRRLLKESQGNEQELATRNSELMHQLISQNGADLENVNSPNRPSHVSELFQTLSTDVWLAAKEELDSNDPYGNNEKRCRFLCEILVEARKAATNAYNRCEQYVWTAVNQPLELAAPMETETRGLASDLKKAFARQLVMKCHQVRTDRIAKEVLQGIRQNALPRHVTKGCNVAAYVKECCRVAWMMVVQQTPITLRADDEGKRPSENLHDIYFECSRSQTAVISYFILPALMHGDKCLKKGLVYTKERW